MTTLIANGLHCVTSERSVVMLPAICFGDVVICAFGFFVICAFGFYGVFIDFWVAICHGETKGRMHGNDTHTQHDTRSDTSPAILLRISRLALKRNRAPHCATLRPHFEP